MGLKEKHIDTTYASIADDAFEEMYAAVREKEGRVYTDKQVVRLPEIDGTHKYALEWRARKISSARLINYLTKKEKPLHILEIGCGNGWLANKLTGIPQAKVTGLDTSQLEIDQARRVFKNVNLKFINSEFTKAAVGNNERFDVIVFAASLSYFPFVKAVIDDAFSLLKPGGEIHVLDTPFYKNQIASVAIARCREYYNDMGYPAMAANYYHHLLAEILPFKHRVLFNPATIWNRLRKQGVFYWITLTP
ncbi:Methyltransferase domain-containing protein [Mucilaginibacter pineti]|uniref:Methyltransferase domain-containing protein n=1 Tax=Mucilaginibacter pineti TaxID=1391627 RepID=A0A1G6T7Y7_9SPHI|nr:class I SAM-dependent methyltransferase [Mucilaginibacter pineti]SDD25232.1 Methyltransferase domain-containing protein [Mucilaginibacter pineti]